MNTRHYHNGLKTTVLLGGMWALLLAIGYAIALGTRQSMWIFIFAGIGTHPNRLVLLELCDDGLAFDECLSGD